VRKILSGNYWSDVKKFDKKSNYDLASFDPRLKEKNMSSLVHGNSSTTYHHQLPSAELEFVAIRSSSPHFSKVEEIFRSQIEPLYGNQDEALRKIKDGTDRKCEVLLNNDHLVGFIVYKREMQKEYESIGLIDSFEVKSLAVIEPGEKTRDTYGTMLINRVIQLAQRKFAKNLHITVSEKDKNLVEFLRSKGFSILATWQDKYIKGVREFLFQINVPEKKITRIIRQAESGSKEEEKEVSKKNEKSHFSEKSKNRDLEKQERKKDRISYEVVSNKESKKRKREESPPEKESIQMKENQRKKRKAEIDDQKSKEQSISFRDRRGLTHSTGRDCSESTSSRPSFYSESRRRHELTLRKKYIHQIKSGQKTIEGRINSGIVLSYKPGDQIRFFYQQDPSDDVLCDITAIQKYESFRELLRQEGYRKCLTDVRSLEEAVKVYDQIPGYAERAAKFGVVAIHLNLKK
jgi:ASC-1-like (ASCH) protein